MSKVLSAERKSRVIKKKKTKSLPKTYLSKRIENRDFYSTINAYFLRYQVSRFHENDILVQINSRVYDIP